MKTSDVLNKLEEYAPLEISRAFVAAGAYDNSGLLVDTGEPVKKAAFTLELSAAAVAFAEEEGCNLIVTHHPAIYRRSLPFVREIRRPVRSLRRSARGSP